MSVCFAEITPRHRGGREGRRPQDMQFPAFHAPGPASIAGFCTNRRTGRTGECRAKSFIRQPRNKCRGLHGRQGWSARGMQKPTFSASNPASNAGVCTFSAPRTKMPGVCMLPGVLRVTNPAETSAPPREIGWFAWSAHANPRSLCREIGLHTDSRISCADFRAEHEGLHGWQGQRARAMQTPAFYVPDLHKSHGFAWAGASARAKMQTPAFHASNPAPNTGVCIAAPAPSAAPRLEHRIGSARSAPSKPLLHFRHLADPRVRGCRTCSARLARQEPLL